MYHLLVGTCYDEVIESISIEVSYDEWSHRLTVGPQGGCLGTIITRQQHQNIPSSYQDVILHA